MYHSHFGFDTLPFNINPDSQFTFLSTGFLRTRETVLRGLRGKNRCVVLSGAPGSGKTTLLNHLCQHPPAGYEYIRVPYASLSFPQLLEQIYERLVPATTSVSTPLEQTDALLATLVRQRRHDQQFVVVIDEAQNLTDSTLRALLELTADADPGEPLLRLLLAGHPELVSNMRAAEAAGGFASDKTRYCELQPLAPELIDDYIRYRLTAAGGEQIDLFSDEAVGLIWQYSKGVPRLINMLCGYALLVAFEESHPLVDRDIVLESVASLDCGEPTEPQLAAVLPPAAPRPTDEVTEQPSMASRNDDASTASNSAAPSMASRTNDADSSAAQPAVDNTRRRRTNARPRPSFHAARPASPSANHGRHNRHGARDKRSRRLIATAFAFSALAVGLLAWRAAEFSVIPDVATAPALTAVETPLNRPDSSLLTLPPPPPSTDDGATTADANSVIKPSPATERNAVDDGANDYIQTILRKQQNLSADAVSPQLARTGTDAPADPPLNTATTPTDQAPQTVADWKIELSSLSSTAENARPTPAALNGNTVGPDGLNAATILELGHFVTASGVQDRAPFGVSDTFSPGRIYAFARVYAPKDEVLTLSWYHAGGRLISQLQLEVRRNVSGGYRTYGWKTLYQPGNYEVRLYNEEQALIARRGFAVR